MLVNPDCIEFHMSINFKPIIEEGSLEATSTMLIKQTCYLNENDYTVLTYMVVGIWYTCLLVSEASQRIHNEAVVPI